MYQFLRGLTYDQPGTIKNDTIDISLFEQVVQNLENTDGTTKGLKDKSTKYKKLRNDRESKKDQTSVDGINFDEVYKTTA